jgi:hypothetical protein
MPPIFKLLARAWFAVGGFLLLTLVLSLTLVGYWGQLADRFLFEQDFTVFVTVVVVAAVASFAPTQGGNDPESRAQGGAFSEGLTAKRQFAVVAGLALLCGLVTWIGTWLVFENYPLSMDEFMANFDAAIVAHGQGTATLPPNWRPYLYILQPIFVLSSPGEVVWSSTYLPVNASLRAIGLLVGAPSAVSPLLAVISVVATYCVAQRMWPARRDLALVATILLATSSQFLVTAMTPYAMTAQLAFNLLWLWLFLRRDVVGHAGAIAVGFLACGVHQYLFHILFVAPILFELLLERRWRLAAIYAAAYGVICSFWISYPQIVRPLVGQPSAAHALGHAAAADFAIRILPLLKPVNPSVIGLMVEHAIRFATWQNILLVPLVTIGAVAAIKAGGTVRSLMLGIILTTLAMILIMPIQGHGWGYRYWHGLLGSFCLLAAFAWGRVTGGITPFAKSKATLLFTAAAVLSILVLVPLRAWQAHIFIHPYARAEAAIQRAPSQVVLLDDRGAWYTADLIRNDPFLRNRPLVMSIMGLTDQQLRDICARFTVGVFDARDAFKFGIRLDYRRYSSRGRHRVDILLKARCGPRGEGVIDIGPKQSSRATSPGYTL